MPRRRRSASGQLRLDLRGAHPDVVGYTRVSSSDQCDGLSLDAQERAIRAYCELRQFRLVELVCDPGVSAGKPLRKRRGGKRMIELLEDGQAVGVVSMSLDRIFRDVIDCLDTVRGWDSRGVALHLVEFGGQPIDTSSAVGSMFLLFSAGFAEFWRRRTSEKVRQIKQSMREQGRWTGGKPPLGYCVEDGRLVEVPTEQQALRIIRGLRAKGAAPAEIARRLNATVPPTRGKRWYINTVIRQLDDYQRAPRDRTGYGPAFHRRVRELRGKGVLLPDIGRMLIREGWEPIGGSFSNGSLSRIARGVSGHERVAAMRVEVGRG